MFYPTTGLQVASHDAWLDEMNKEPSPELGQVVKAEAKGGRMRGVASRLAGVARRLRPQRWPEVPAVPDTPAQATGANL
jgi:hypothetical protein